MEEPATERNKPAKRQPTKLSGKQIAIFWLIILAIIGFFIVKAVVSPKAKYQVSDTQVTFISDTTVSVSFKVKNIGKSAGTPICNINAHSPDSTYYGGDMPTLDKKLQPGETTTTAGPITVNKNGAANVTTADISCS